MLKSKKQKQILVSSTPLDGQIMGVVVASRRFRVSDVAGATSALAQEVLEELCASAKALGADALSGLQYSMVGGSARGEAMRSIGHILGWATAVATRQDKSIEVSASPAPAPAWEPRIPQVEDFERPEPSRSVMPPLPEPKPKTEPDPKPKPKTEPEPDPKPEPLRPAPADYYPLSPPTPVTHIPPSPPVIEPFPKPSSPTTLAHEIAAAISEQVAPRLWKVRNKEGQVYKPAPEEKLISLLKAGKLKQDVDVCEQDGTLWRPVREVIAFQKAFM